MSQILEKKRTRPDKLLQKKASFIAKVYVSNLNPTVSKEDVRELFCHFGPIKSIQLARPGTATIDFYNENDAEKACDLYQNRLLDGLPMNCYLLNGAQQKRCAVSQRPASTLSMDHQHHRNKDLSQALSRASKTVTLHEEEKEPKETIQLENKMKNSMRPHYKAMRSESNYSSSEKEKQKNDGCKERVASNKLSNNNAKKSQFMTPTKTVSTGLEKKDTDSVQNVNMMIKQRKDTNVTFMASNKLHSIDKNFQFKNSTKFVGLSQFKSQTSVSSKKLNRKNESQERPDMIKDTKLPYAKGKEGQFSNITKTASIPESRSFNPASSRKQSSVNITKEREHLSYSMGKESQHMYTSKNVEKKTHRTMPHPVQEIKSKDVQKIKSKDVSTSKNIQIENLSRKSAMSQILEKKHTMPDMLVPNTASFIAKVYVSNLHPTVSKEDVRELFCDIGLIKSIQMTLPGTAVIDFYDENDAEKACDLYNNRLLDGLPMNCYLLSRAQQKRCAVSQRPASTLSMDHHHRNKELSQALSRASKTVTLHEDLQLKLFDDIDKFVALYRENIVIEKAEIQESQEKMNKLIKDFNTKPSYASIVLDLCKDDPVYLNFNNSSHNDARLRKERKEEYNLYLKKKNEQEMNKKEALQKSIVQPQSLLITENFERVILKRNEQDERNQPKSAECESSLDNELQELSSDTKRKLKIAEDLNRYASMIDASTDKNIALANRKKNKILKIEKGKKKTVTKKI